MTSLTPCRDATERVIAQALAKQAETPPTEPYLILMARLRDRVLGELLRAMADEIDMETSQAMLDPAAVNLFANLACTAVGYTRLKDPKDTDRVAAAFLIEAGMMLMSRAGTQPTREVREMFEMKPGGRA